MKTNSLFNPLSLTGMALISLSCSLHAQTTIAGWTFENLSAATNTNPAPSTNNSAGAVSVASIGMTLEPTPGTGTNAPDVTAGVSGDTGTNTVADLTKVWRVRATGAGNGWSSLAPIGSQGAQFNASTAGFNNIKISFDWYSTTQGEANLQLEYTTDGTTWINAPVTLGGSDSGATVLTNSTSGNNLVVGSYVNGGTAGQEWFTGLTATIVDPNAANDANFGIRMVNAATGAACLSMSGAALNNSSGNWRFDNVAISGTAVPEPGTYVALLGGVGMLLGMVRRRRS